MELDRELQRKTLEILRDNYPRPAGLSFLKEYCSDQEKRRGNLHYLHEHGLIELQSAGTAAKITAKGLDFLEADGGVDAILRTVTVKFDPDQLRKILMARVGQLDIPPETKKPLQEKFKAMPVEVLQSVLIRLAEKGLEHAPDALSLIQRVVL